MCFVLLLFHNQNPSTNNPAQYIMTPINFISFLVSLYLVDYHYRNKREHFHENGQKGNRLRDWLHQLIFRPQPYAWIGGASPAPPNQAGRNWYYHTKQKKLMKMEAAEAFEMRGSVLMVLVILAFGAVWGLSRLLVAAGKYYYYM
jgi:hypothetical protein